MQKNCETCWIQNKNLDGVINLPWSSRFVHTEKKKIITEKIKKSLGEKQVLEKENSKENYLQGNKEEESRAGERQAAAQHEVLRITATGRGHLIFFPPKKTERKISSDRKTTTCKQEFVRRQFKHETCVHLM